MSQSPSYNPADPIKDIMLMVAIKRPLRTHFTIWGEKSPGTLYWEDMFEILDIYINGKPFNGLADNKIDIRFYLSSEPFKDRSLIERLMGVMPSYWADFFIGFKGHYCLSAHLDIAQFDYLSGCDTFIMSSHDMRNEKGKPIRTPFNYAQYSKEDITSVASILTFHKYAPMPEGTGGKRKPKPTLADYFASVPEHHATFN
jgi:hypothetical protein